MSVENLLQKRLQTVHSLVERGPHKRQFLRYGLHVLHFVESPIRRKEGGRVLCRERALHSRKGFLGGKRLQLRLVAVADFPRMLVWWTVAHVRLVHGKRRRYGRVLRVRLVAVESGVAHHRVVDWRVESGIQRQQPVDLGRLRSSESHRHACFMLSKREG